MAAVAGWQAATAAGLSFGGDDCWCGKGGDEDGGRDLSVCFEIRLSMEKGFGRRETLTASFIAASITKIVIPL